MGLLTSVPLMGISVVLYAVLWLFSGSDPTGDGGQVVHGKAMEGLLESGITLTMFSGDQWKLSWGDGLLTLSLVLLFIEIIKATSTGAASIINHGLSMIIFVLALILFIVAPGFANTVFFLITMMTLFDVMAGFTVTTVAAKRDLGVAPGVIGTN